MAGFAKVAKAIVQRKMARVMKEWKGGTLVSSSGQKVTNQKQAIAIGMSEARAAARKKH